MQAGVPIVPVVIHNAGDVAPKNEFVMRAATVRVDVLPPVDTSTWKPATVGRHVTEVRNMFLRCLGQPEESLAVSVEEEDVDFAPPRKKADAGAGRKTKPKPRAKPKPAAKPANKRAG